MRIQVNARNRACHFEAETGARLLYAGLAAGINLPYECGSGTCGTCKARLIAGEVDELWPQAPGRKLLKQTGEFLMCQSVARDDCTVEIANFVYNMDPGACVPAFRTGTITHTKALTHDVIAFSVALAHPADFDAGQYVTMQVPGVPGYRGYSMVNFERAASRLDFVVKRKPGGACSEWLFKSNADGAAVELFGPLGVATFYPSLGKNILCIAGGSGIAGMMSILARARQERYFDQFNGHVFFGVRTYADGFYLAELSQLASEFPDRLHVTIALSDEAVPAPALQAHPALVFEHGLVHEVAGKTMHGKYQNVRAYLAGPPPAVDASIRMLLLQAKLPADSIRYDKFS
ncbi:MAG: 2Fe-2S iron-sulfur cluster binding domain-containing protein [Burkholderiaceae bacterium]|nr:2Fe-2S iron-sulfur cluster binding domain-containing protein [Burkholderiaceae bacterium]